MPYRPPMDLSCSIASRTFSGVSPPARMTLPGTLAASDQSKVSQGRAVEQQRFGGRVGGREDGFADADRFPDADAARNLRGFRGRGAARYRDRDRLRSVPSFRGTRRRIRRPSRFRRDQADPWPDCIGVHRAGTSVCKDKPSACAPASIAASASSRLVIPQIFTNIRPPVPSAREPRLRSAPAAHPQETRRSRLLVSRGCVPR